MTVARMRARARVLCCVLCVVCCVCVCVRRVLVFVCALQVLAISLGSLQMIKDPVLLMCTTVYQGHGRRLSSAWRALFLQLLLLETWPSSRGVIQEVCCCGLMVSP
jgi:hypothetical protein